MKINKFLLDVPMLTVGLSGGCDSICLLHWLINNGYSVDAVHVNHNINENSKIWAEFCHNFCNENDITYYEFDVNVNNNGNLENEARKVRYDCYKTVGRNIILAHHMDDQQETIMLKLLRGSGIHGLIGMREVNIINGVSIIRPMLKTTRKEIKEYAEKHKLSWIEDPSNSDNKNDRNFLRNVVLPIINERYSRFYSSLNRSLDSLRDDYEILEEIAITDEKYTKWDIRKLNELSDARIKNLLKYKLRVKNYYNFSHSILNEFVKIVRCNNPNAKSKFPFGYQRGYMFNFLE